ncbi:hypothetical protein OOZ19_00885 [Saccharopolyspora sp. NFXS83]|uniref:hypothetical protein n=1 Tax=Saccharopolyspora sp. NFXS83 TaxID=2993560 RepID=UPI00224A7BBF|nr:hypothetical protein [Saccharopolyspora sp. NFXS83]MCX2728786.1 hypothetical protein [Saccharopolyspora sp. NFXS83]
MERPTAPRESTTIAPESLGRLLPGLGVELPAARLDALIDFQRHHEGTHSTNA